MLIIVKAAEFTGSCHKEWQFIPVLPGYDIVDGQDPFMGQAVLSPMPGIIDDQRPFVYSLVQCFIDIRISVPGGGGYLGIGIQVDLPYRETGIICFNVSRQFVRLSHMKVIILVVTDETNGISPVSHLIKLVIGNGLVHGIPGLCLGGYRKTAHTDIHQSRVSALVIIQQSEEVICYEGGYRGKGIG